jgi:hypothetical protein
MSKHEVIELAASTSSLLADAFDRRTVTEMEIALTRACEVLPRDLDSHENRSYIAKQIIKRVNAGERTFGGMVAAGMAAVEEMRRRPDQV